MLPDDRARARQEWQNRVTAEYRSAAVTGQLLHWLIQAAFSDELVRVAIRIVGDELDHSKLSYDCLVSLGGGDEPAVMDIAHLAEPVSSDGLLASITDSVVRNFCLGETFAVPLFGAMRDQTFDPMAKQVLDRVLRDEAVHRAFGWDALDELIERDPVGVRLRIQQFLPQWIREFERGYGTPRPTVPLSDMEKAVGLLDLAKYVEIFRETLNDDIRARFAKRAIELPS